MPTFLRYRKPTSRRAWRSSFRNWGFVTFPSVVQHVCCGIGFTLHVRGFGLHLLRDVPTYRSFSLDVNMELLDQLEFSDVEKDKFIQLEFQTLPVTISCPKYVHSAFVIVLFPHIDFVDAATCPSRLEKISWKTRACRARVVGIDGAATVIAPSPRTLQQGISQNMCARIASGMHCPVGKLVGFVRGAKLLRLGSLARTMRNALRGDVVCEYQLIFLCA